MSIDTFMSFLAKCSCLVFISLSTVWLAACDPTAHPVGIGTESRPPNIIVILADDQRADSLGFTGHPIIKTPNIDALAAQGAFFNNAFVTSASCTPSRTSILTGQYERKHGVTFNSDSALSHEAFARTYPMILKENGYFVGYVGKNHTPVGKSEKGFGYDSGVFEAGFDYWYGNHGHMGFYPKKRHPVYEGAGPDTQVEILRDGVLNFLSPDPGFSSAYPELKPRPQDKPFALLVNFNLPHSNGVSSMEQKPGDPELYRTTYRELLDAMPIPETYIAYEEIATPRIPKHIYANEYIKSYSYVKTPGSLKEHTLREGQTITGIDQFVGKVVEVLKEQGLADNTIIVYLSDHGVQHGEHGLGGKMLLYEESIRVPFIIYDPRIAVDHGGKRLDEIVLSIDIFPTLLDLARIPIPEANQGRSLQPLLKGEADSWRLDFFLENMFMGQGYPRIEAVRNERFKYIRYFDPEKNQPHRFSLMASIEGEQAVYEELFDLEADPLERRNLAGDPDYSATLEQMRRRCHELLLEAKDGDAPPDTYLNLRKK